jgi:hypothetical protein
MSILLCLSWLVRQLLFNVQRPPLRRRHAFLSCPDVFIISESSHKQFANGRVRRCEVCHLVRQELSAGSGRREEEAPVEEGAEVDAR